MNHTAPIADLEPVADIPDARALARAGHPIYYVMNPETSAQHGPIRIGVIAPRSPRVWLVPKDARSLAASPRVNPAYDRLYAGPLGSAPATIVGSPLDWHRLNR